MQQVYQPSEPQKSRSPVDVAAESLLSLGSLPRSNEPSPIPRSNEPSPIPRSEPGSILRTDPSVMFKSEPGVPNTNHLGYPAGGLGSHSGGRTSSQYRPPQPSSTSLPSMSFLSKTANLDMLKEMPSSAKDSTIYGAPGAGIPPKTTQAMTSTLLSSTAKLGGRVLYPLPTQSAMSLLVKPKEDPEKHMTPEQKQHRKFLVENQKVEAPQCGCVGE